MPAGKQTEHCTLYSVERGSWAQFPSIAGADSVDPIRRPDDHARPSRSREKGQTHIEIHDRSTR